MCCHTSISIMSHEHKCHAVTLCSPAAISADTGVLKHLHVTEPRVKKSLQVTEQFSLSVRPQQICGCRQRDCSAFLVFCLIDQFGRCSSFRLPFVSSKTNTVVPPKRRPYNETLTQLGQQYIPGLTLITLL